MNLRALLDAANAVVNNADNTGCSEDLTVTSQGAIDNLSNLLPDFREFVEEWENNFPDSDKLPEPEAKDFEPGGIFFQGDN